MPVPIPKDAVVDKAVPIPGDASIDPASVFAPPPTTGQRLKSIGKTVGQIGAGATPPLVGGAIGGGLGASAAIAAGQPELAEEAAAGGRTVGQAVGGLFSPTAEFGAAKAMGEKVAPPTIHDALKSAGWNLGLGAIGELGTVFGAGKQAAQAGEMAKLPKEARTAGNLNQAVKNRDFLKQLGMGDKDIDFVLSSPDAQAELVRIAKGADATKRAFKTVDDSTKAAFNARYDAAIPAEKAKAAVDIQPLADTSHQALQTGERELTPNFASFLERKFGRLQGPSATSAEAIDKLSDYDAIVRVYGAKDAARLQKGSAQTLAQWAKGARAQLQQQAEYAAKVGATPLVTAEGKAYALSDLRDLRTELRESVPSKAARTPLDDKVYNQLYSKLTDLRDTKLKELGSSNEDIARLHAIDQEWGTYKDTIQEFDPRNERFGPEMAKALFDPMLRSPGLATNFIALAEAAEQAHPGQVMPGLRSAFVTKAAESISGGAPMDQMRILQKLYTQWNGEPGTRAVLKSMFGANSPMTDPATFSRVLGAANNPKAVAESATSGINMIRPPQFLLRLGMAYGLYSLATGSVESPWSDMRKDPARFLGGMIVTMAGLTFARRFLSEGNTLAQNTYVDFLTNPNPKTLRRFAEIAGAGAGSIQALPDSNLPR